MHTTLHQCQLSNTETINGYIHLISEKDAVVFYGNFQLGLNNKLVKKIKDKTQNIYAMQDNDLLIQHIDHSDWVTLISQSKTVFSWK